MLFGLDFLTDVFKGLLQLAGFMLVSFVVGFLLGAWIF